MGINMIEQNEEDIIMEYKFPDFINENKDIGKKPDDFEILQVIGGGTFSQVLKVKSKKNFGIYALKKIDKEALLAKFKRKKYYDNEKFLIKKLSHPNVIKCYDVLEEDKYLYFIMDFMNNNDLESFNIAKNNFNVPIEEGKLWEIFYKCLKGLNYIHEQGIIHRDIKLKNIFLDDDFNVRIGDFNISAVQNVEFAKKFSNDENDIDDLMNGLTILGTKGYIPPEIKSQIEYDEKVDIYSMGIAFFELCYGYNPDLKNQKDKKNSCKVSEDLKVFISNMMKFNSKDRPSSKEAMMIAKENFIKTYVKDTSIEAVLRCFNNFPNFSQYFSNYEEANFISSGKKEIAQSCQNIILSMKNNNEKEIKNNIYNLRKISEKEGLDLKGDNIEIDPVIFIIFFIKKLNSELNKICSGPNNKKMSENEEIKRFKILSKKYHFPPGKERYYYKLFLYCYNTKILSFISKNFFSYLITERTCKSCKTSRKYLSQIYFLPVNVNILKQSMQNNNFTISLQNGLNYLTQTITNIDTQKAMVCRICDKISEFTETKNFYHTSKNLIIVFDRGENCDNITFVDFEENLSLKNLDEKLVQVNYKLTGIIAKINEEYISFVQINNIWISSKGEQSNFEKAKKAGIVVALFYYSENNLSIENKENIDLSTIQLEERIFMDKYNYNNVMKSLIKNNNTGINQQNIQQQFNGFIHPQQIGMGFNNPQQIGYGNPQQIGYGNPQQIGYGNPQQFGYNPQQSGYNPQQSGYNPQQSGYNPQETRYINQKFDNETSYTCNEMGGIFSQINSKITESSDNINYNPQNNNTQNSNQMNNSNYNIINNQFGNNPMNPNNTISNNNNNNNQFGNNPMNPNNTIYNNNNNNNNNQPGNVETNPQIVTQKSSEIHFDNNVGWL